MLLMFVVLLALDIDTEVMRMTCVRRDQDSVELIFEWFFQELKESFNYGLFYPPVNGKAGKFLDEERRLGDYPFNGRVGYLEVKALFLLLLGNGSFIIVI